MGGRTGRGGEGTREPTCIVGGQTGDQDGEGGDQGNAANEGVEKVPEFTMVIAQLLQNLLLNIVAQVGSHASNIQGDVRNVSVSNGQSGCSYKEFLACNPKDYDGKSVEATEPTTIQSAVLKAGKMLTDEAIRNGSLRKNTEKKGNGGEPSGDGNVRDDNKRSRTGRAFDSTTNPVRKEYKGAAPKCKNYNFHYHPEVPCRTCTNCNCLGHFAKDCRVMPRMVNPLNARNLTAAREVCFGCDGTDLYKARGRAFMMGAEEARQDPNIVTGTFTLNNHDATTLFDSGTDYSWVSTTFIPLLDIEPNNLGMDWLSRKKAEIVCNTPKLGCSGIMYPGALLHNIIAQVMRERPLNVLFEKKKAEIVCNTPKLGRSEIMYPGALLHNAIAQVMRE
uniref:CCHC-type domain-containing protein n=1 Tax=Tanacetum cinerariifolium TaxID=118510 RepID=A0A6L2P620_TANCI|nr:hypothetical protein [Tanacetum cinerariifolium]